MLDINSPAALGDFVLGRDGIIPTRMSKSKDRPYEIAGHQEGSNYRVLPPAVINRNDPEDLCYTFAEGPFSSCTMLESMVFEFLWLLRSLDRHYFFLPFDKVSIYG